MRSLIIVLVTAVFLAAAAACSAVETWIAVSTEVGEELDGTGFRDRHALKLDGFDYTWPGSIFFDPGDIIKNKWTVEGIKVKQKASDPK